MLPVQQLPETSSGLLEYLYSCLVLVRSQCRRRLLRHRDKHSRRGKPLCWRCNHKKSSRRASRAENADTEHAMGAILQTTLWAVLPMEHGAPGSMTTRHTLLSCRLSPGSAALRPWASILDIARVQPQRVLASTFLPLEQRSATPHCTCASCE